MTEFREPTTAPITDGNGDVRGRVTSFSVASDSAGAVTRRWLEIEGTFDDRRYGRVTWTSRIPLGEGLTIVREPRDDQ